MSDQVAEVSAKYLAEAANNGVPTGYKQTEVGVIPEDWAIEKLGSIGKFKNGINKSADDFGFGYPFVNLMDVFGKPAIRGDESFGLINSTEIDKKEYSLVEGDVLFIRSSVKPSGVGLTTVVMSDLKETVYSGFLIRFRTDKQLVTEFKRHCFYEESFRGRVISGSTVSANTNINQDALKDIYFVFPGSKKEQTAIANALSDVDALIQELEKLIAKKQAIKTATMQQLLTGRTRLPQFAHHPDGRKKGYKPSELGEIPEDWEVKSLGDLFEITSSKRVFQSDWKTSGIPFFRAREIAAMEFGSIENDLFISEEHYQKIVQTYGIPHVGDILVTGVGTLGKVFLVNDNKPFYFKDGNIIWYKIKGSIDSRFLLQLYKFPIVIAQVQGGSSGTTVGTYTITAAKKTLIPFPAAQEQAAISACLSAMDEEIHVLEKRLSKTRQIKQGMMQELLTGKTRLVKPAGAA